MSAPDPLAMIYDALLRIDTKVDRIDGKTDAVMVTQATHELRITALETGQNQRSSRRWDVRLALLAGGLGFIAGMWDKVAALFHAAS